jgi:putative addiction module component (TIGR02574 family)
MTTYTEILSAAMNLPPQQRDELAVTLWDSLPDDGSYVPELSDAWKQEIARRSAEIDAGTAKYVTWEEVKQRARRAAGHDA